MVQYAVLAWAHDHPALTRWTDNIRILETLEQEQLLKADTAQGLINAYKTYRSATHRLKLQQAAGRVSMQEFMLERELVVQVWQRLFGV